MQIVLEWARRNQETLMANWNRTRLNEDPLWIDY